MKGQKSVFDKIQECQSCPLYKYQKPLLDKLSEADVFWVGLSAVQVECTESDTPLSSNTNSGKLISQIEAELSGLRFYKTNLVKCLPLNNGKIRYPNKPEMRTCCRHLSNEIKAIEPKLVFLLGKQVGDFLTDAKNTRLSDEFRYSVIQQGEYFYVPVHHPSYILVYKRKHVNSYIQGIKDVVYRFLPENGSNSTRIVARA